MKTTLALLLAATLCGCTAPAVQPAADVAFVYHDLDAFAASHAALRSGAAPVDAMRAYLDGTSPGYAFYGDRYGATAESIAAAIARHPLHYARVAGLKPELQRFERRIESGAARLSEWSGGGPPPPVFFLVGNLTAGGTPVALAPPVDGHDYGVGIAVEAVSMADDTERSEFTEPYGGGYLADIPYVAVHEMVHVYQVRAQGIDNYRSIYRPGPNNTYLAVAIREGCADYLTHEAIGARRTGPQHEYGLAHERDLWEAFQAVMDEPASFADGWFGALDPATPDWPPQIGYWLGMRMCEAYHRSADDPAAAMRDIFSTYGDAGMRRFADAYAAQR